FGGEGVAYLQTLRNRVVVRGIIKKLAHFALPALPREKLRQEIPLEGYRVRNYVAYRHPVHFSDVQFIIYLDVDVRCNRDGHLFSDISDQLGIDKGRGSFILVKKMKCSQKT